MSNDPSTIVQYAIIILRDDAEAQLPGAPKTGLPLVFNPGLNPGEVVFTKDTGRMFVGHSPTAGQVNFNRTSIPYQAVEVLTEASIDRFGEMVDDYLAETSDNSFYSATMPSSASFTPIWEPRASDPDNIFKFTDVSSLAAFVDYAGFDANGHPVRMGRLHIMHYAGNAVPSCHDVGTDMATPLLSFSASETGPTGGRYVVINYKYTGSGNLTLKYRVTHVTASDQP